MCLIICVLWKEDYICKDKVFVVKQYKEYLPHILLAAMITFFQLSGSSVVAYPPPSLAGT